MFPWDVSESTPLYGKDARCNSVRSLWAMAGERGDYACLKWRKSWEQRVALFVGGIQS